MDNNSLNTEQQFKDVMVECRGLFAKKLHDYSASWRILRPQSLTDQLFIKAKRIRSIEIKRCAKIDEGIRQEFIALINYGIIGLIQLDKGFVDSVDLSNEEALKLYDHFAEEALQLMLKKNHDYDEAWRSMRISSYTDFILTKIQRVKELEDINQEALVSEGIDANYMDIKTKRVVKEMLRQAIVNICRLVLALVFIFSGFVKAIDPLGTVYKLQDYLFAAGVNLTALPQWVFIVAAIALSTLEFILGIFLLFGIHRHIATRLMLIFMVVMTMLTTWIFLADPVKDCGCFGDALVLTNGQTLFKNLVLLICAVVVFVWFEKIVRFISHKAQWVVVNYSLLFVLVISMWSLYSLPMFDFRPYHIGADFRQGTEIPEGAEQPKFETKFILSKNGKTQEFTLDDYPDSTWTFVDSKTIETSKGYVPPMHDFMVENRATGEDLTNEVVKSDGNVLLLIAPDLSSADDGNFGEIEQIYEYAMANDIAFYCLTASDSASQHNWREKTGAEYDMFFVDNTTLKTVVRSNPGLMLVKNGVIVGKWSHNTLPTEEEIGGLISKKQPVLDMRHSLIRRSLTIILWFVIPLLALTLADRLWAWSQWGKRMTRIKRLKNLRLSSKRIENNKEE